MKFTVCILLCVLIFNTSYSQQIYTNNFFSGNNICNYFQQTGIFNSNNFNSYGITWPCGSNDSYVYTTGPNIACMINDSFAMTVASYRGEWSPGYYNINGMYVTNPDFKIYNIKSSDNASTNPDYANWYKMIPYGAPYQDINGNGIYDQNSDIPGIKDASQTLFLALSDGDLSQHSFGEGFGGGITAPLVKADLRMTVWSYKLGALSNVQFIKYDIINKNSSSWDKMQFSMFIDPDIANAFGKYLGCDTLLNLGYGYAGDSTIVSGAYGMMLLKGLINRKNNDTLGMTSFSHIISTGGGPACEQEANGEPFPAYRLMKGYKKDGSVFLDPTYQPFRPTKFVFSGDPETNTGWVPSKGYVFNCVNYPQDTAGFLAPVNIQGLVSSGSDDLSVSPGDTQRIYVAQMLAKGYSNKNSVTKLKQTARIAKEVSQKIINEIEVIHTPAIVLPEKFHLYQNFPNPFNPSTKIKFDVPENDNDQLSRINIGVFDISGRQIAELTNADFSPGTYEVQWTANNLSAGVYFIKFYTKGFKATKKMVLLK